LGSPEQGIKTHYFTSDYARIKQIKRCIMRVVTVILVFVISIYVFSATLFAQGESLEETLQQLSEDAAMQYVSPISSAFGSDLNGGWFHKVPKPVMVGFNVEIGVVAMGTFFPDASKSFSVNGRFRFSEPEARQLVSGQGFPSLVEDELVDQITSKYFTVGISGATVTGAEDDHIIVSFPGETFTVSSTNYAVPSQDVDLGIGGFQDLADLSFLPLAAPQLSVGTVYGTQATLRYLPSLTLNDELGKLKYFGFGIQHNPGIWMSNPWPVDIALSFFTQDLKIGDLFKTKATAFGLNVCKQFGPSMLNVTPYAGFMFESADMEVTYTYTVVTSTGTYTEDISFKLESENKNRVILGLSLRLLTFNLNADYNLSKYDSFTVGLTFGK
jgi:hypothetical protein